MIIYTKLGGPGGAGLFSQDIMREHLAIKSWRAAVVVGGNFTLAGDD